VLVAQERMANNFVYVFHKKQPAKYSWVAEIRSHMEKTNRPPSSFAVKMMSKGKFKGSHGECITATMPYIKADIPVVILFRALGFISDKEILDHICYDHNDKVMMECMRPSLEETYVIQSQDVALDYIAKRGSAFGSTREKRINYAKSILEKDVLPHVSTEPNSENKKAFFIGYMVHRLCNAAIGRVGEDDRDHYGKKRLDMAGSLLGGLFRQLFRKFTKEATTSLQKDVDDQKDMNLRSAFKPRTITHGLRYALATGNWGTNKSGQVLKTGVAQVLNRLTFASSLSHLRRLNTPLQKQGKLTKPRQLHNTHWGMICPAETPEGQACGLVKNLSLMAFVSVGSYTAPIIKFLEEFGIENLTELNPDDISTNTKVFVNGSWIGIHSDAEGLMRQLKGMRRKMWIVKEVSMVRDITNKEIK
jgi:DNA-directed RNA polymerase II subunit RPB2